MRAAGGLFILGTERHESRRIDNQLRGRAGRQGDPGEPALPVLEDDIMRLFGRAGHGHDGEAGRGRGHPIDAKILSNAIENAQSRWSPQLQTRSIKTVLSTTT